MYLRVPLYGSTKYVKGNMYLYITFLIYILFTIITKLFTSTVAINVVKIRTQISKLYNRPMLLNNSSGVVGTCKMYTSKQRRFTGSIIARDRYLYLYIFRF